MLPPGRRELALRADASGSLEASCFFRTSVGVCSTSASLSLFVQPGRSYPAAIGHLFSLRRE